MAACKRKCKTTLNAGDLEHRVVFQSVTQTTDAAGGFTESWATSATVWGKLEPLKSFEKFVSMQTETHTSHKLTCRYNPAITTAKRMTYSGRVFDVVGVINVEERNTIMIVNLIEGTL